MMKKMQERRAKQFGGPLFYFLFILVLIGFGASLSWSAAGAYPDRPINMVVPFAPGGALDLGSRVVADRIAEFLGQPLISVYKSGGVGSLGV